MYLNNNSLERLSSLEKVTNTLSQVSLGDLTLFYSYNIIVGFNYRGELTLVDNIYSKTTSRDLNLIDRGNRVSLEVFKIRLRKLLYKLGLINSRSFIIEEYRDLEVLKGYTRLKKELEDLEILKNLKESNIDSYKDILESIERTLRYIIRVNLDNSRYLEKVESLIEEDLEKDNYILIELLKKEIEENI